MAARQLAHNLKRRVAPTPQPGGNPLPVGEHPRVGAKAVSEATEDVFVASGEYRPCLRANSNPVAASP